MADLSVLIPARNEIWLQRTIDDVFAHARADTEVIVVLDGDWPDPPIQDHPKLRVTHSATVIGQRAATNLGARMSDARYVMKLDAHCSVEEGFDVKLIEADREIGRPDLTQIPRMYNLHAFNWKCLGCGTETYQGPTPTVCAACAAQGRAGGPFERVVYWDLNAGGVNGHHVRSEFWRFDADLHFQYHGPVRPEQRKSRYADVMSSIGACFFMRRDRFFAIGGLDESHGSWGQYGTEIGCKSWLSGGRQIVNRRTWFAHLFRTQGADFGFPYPQPGSAVDQARKRSRELWLENTWPGQKYPLSWLLDHFKPVMGWHEPERDESDDLKRLREKRLRAVAAAGAAFQSRPPWLRRPNDVRALEAAPDGGLAARPTLALTKGLAYYSDCRGDQEILRAVREQIERARGWSYPLVAVTLAPVQWPGPLTGPETHVQVLPLERGYLTMFRQQLAALEALETEVVFLVEHDVLYHPSHFAFTPPRDDTFYYNQHTWRVRPSDGQALFYYCNQVSGLCAHRSLLIDHYRKRIAHVEQHGFDRNLGFEPGGNRRSRALFGEAPVATWMSLAPNVDIKTEHCLTRGRWSVDEFRNKSTCQGWTLSDEIPGWGRTKGRFREFLAELGRAAVQEVA